MAHHVDGGVAAGDKLSSRHPVKVNSLQCTKHSMLRSPLRQKTQVVGARIFMFLPMNVAVVVCHLQLIRQGGPTFSLACTHLCPSLATCSHTRPFCTEHH